MKDKARESFDIIQQEVETAKASWEIWFQLYCNFEQGGPYRISTQIYFPFWNAIYHSQIHYVFLILSDLFGKRKGTHSFKHLLNLCLDRLPPRLVTDCKKLLEAIAPYQKGIGILRGKHFGHKLVGASLPDVLKEANLKIKDVDKVLDVAGHLVGNLACAFLANPPKLDFDSERYAKKTINGILQAQLDEFNQLGKAKRGKPTKLASSQ